MSTLTLGIVVIIYMFILAWLGYIGYKQTKNASDYLLGGRKVNPVIMALSYGATLYFRIGHCRFRRGCGHVRYGNPMALLVEYVYGRCHRFYHIRAEHP